MIWPLSAIGRHLQRRRDIRQAEEDWLLLQTAWSELPLATLDHINRAIEGNDEALTFAVMRGFPVAIRQASFRACSNNTVEVKLTGQIMKATP